MQKIPLGAVASIFVHAAILALLLFGLPELTLEPEEPEVIQVALVVPEEDLPPEPDSAQEQAQSSEEPTEQAPEPEETVPSDQVEERPPSIIRPVYQFGEEDAGSNEPSDGNADSDIDTAETQPSEEQPEEPKPPQQTVETLEVPNSETVTVPETEEDPQTPTESAEAAPSPQNDEGPATTAIDDIPRGIRAGELCVTELRRQLLTAIPPQLPNLLPTYRLDEGTILQVRRGAFRSSNGWINLQFRCEIDDAATKIVSFEFNVGAPVPRAEWARRGLPAS